MLAETIDAKDHQIELDAYQRLSPKWEDWQGYSRGVKSKVY